MLLGFLACLFQSFFSVESNQQLLLHLCDHGPYPYRLYMYTAPGISKKGCHIVNSRYWTRKEMWISSSINNLLLILIVLNFKIKSAGSSKCHGDTVTTFAGALLLIMIFPKDPFGSSIDYRLY